MSNFNVIAYEKENGEVPIEEIQLAKSRRNNFIERMTNNEKT